jgi:nicotinate-nucleotide adenylyltransferase
MLELAIGGHSAFAVCRQEIERGGVNYTADTLSRIHAEDPTRELFFLMGADSLRDLPTWRNPQQICQLATPVMVCRGELGQTASAGESFDWSGLERIIAPERLSDIRDHQVHMPRVDLSSSEIRARVAAAMSIRFRTPRAVEKYIEAHGLYR